MIHSLFVTWDVNPALLQIGSFEIRYYGLLWAFAIGVAALFFNNMIKREGYSEKVFDSIFWYGVLGTVIGARLGHCLFYEPGYYLANPWEILDIRQGGLASHGAGVGIIIGLWLFARKNKLSFIWPMDRIWMASAPGCAAVRIGNLMNSEIYGGPTDMPWGFIFVKNGETIPMHPTQIYEAIGYLAVFVLLYWLYYKRDMALRRPGVMFGISIMGLFGVRFVIEFMKNPQVAFEQGMALNMGQILSIPFIVIGAIILYYALKKTPIAIDKKRK